MEDSLVSGVKEREQPAVTVHVEPFEGMDGTLLMTWQSKIDPLDVKTAFGAIDQALASADGPIYVVVDLLQNPQFPLSDTMFSAVSCYAHPLLAEWLIVGGSRGARAIESFLSRVTGRQNVLWFDSMGAALDHRRDVGQPEE